MALAPGSHLDGYEILAPLGSGGMGDVYRARDPILKREVAIKVLPASVTSDPDRLRRFEQEAQAAAALNHPNILAVHRFGVFEGAPYLVSELLEGCTLRQLQERGPIATRKAIDIGVQIANGLAAAHERGIVHRDLKPENLFVTKDGRVKILDFGLAKLTQPGTPSGSDAPTQAAGAALNTEPGMVLGTVGYMAPEQVRGLPSNHRADIFAFGAVLYEMLSGKRAFQRSTSADTMAAILNEDPPSISQTSQTTPPGLQRVVQRCLEKNPEQRFQSASDLGFALEALSESGSSSNVAVAVPKRRGRKRGLGWSLGLILILAAASGSYFLLKPKNRLPFEHYSIQKVIESKHVGPLAISPDGNYLAAQIWEPNGLRSLVLHHIPTNSERPILPNETHRYQHITFSPDGNYIYLNADSPSPIHYADTYKVPVLGGQATRILGDVDSEISFLDEGHRLCFLRTDPATGKYKVLSADADGADERVLAEYKEPFPQHMLCAADGKYAAAYGTDGLERLDLSTGSKRQVVSSKLLGNELEDMQWAPENRGLYVVSHKVGRVAGQVGLLSLSDGSLGRLTNDLSDYTWVSASEDGRTIATTIYERNSRFAEYSFAESRLDEHPVNDLIWFTWLDEDRIAETSLYTDLKIFDLRTNEVKAVSNPSETVFSTPSKCGKDTLVVSGGSTSSSISTHVYKFFLDGNKPIQLTNGSADLLPQCSSEGKWLYYIDYHDPLKPYLMRQSLNGVGAQKVIQTRSSFDLSPDGKLIAIATTYGTDKQTIEIISAESLERVTSFLLPDDSLGVLTFSADSESIFYLTQKNGEGSHIWRQPLVKANRVKVIDLPPEKNVMYIRASADGKRLGLTLSSPTGEAVVLHDTP